MLTILNIFFYIHSTLSYGGCCQNEHSFSYDESKSMLFGEDEYSCNSKSTFGKCEKLICQPDVIRMKDKQGKGMLFDTIYSSNRTIPFDFRYGRPLDNTALDVYWLSDIQKSIGKNTFDRTIMMYILKRMHFYIESKGKINDIFALPYEQRTIMYDDSLIECFNNGLKNNPDLKLAALTFLNKMQGEILRILLENTNNSNDNAGSRIGCIPRMNGATDESFSEKILSLITSKCINTKNITVSKYALLVLLENVNHLISYINNCIDLYKKFLCRSAIIAVLNGTATDSEGVESTGNYVILIDEKSTCSGDSLNANEEVPAEDDDGGGTSEAFRAGYARTNGENNDRMEMADVSGEQNNNNHSPSIAPSGPAKQSPSASGNHGPSAAPSGPAKQSTSASGNHSPIIIPSNRVKQAGEQNSSGSANHTPGIILDDPVEQAGERHPLGNSNHAREPNGNRDRSPTTLPRKTSSDEIDRNHQENDGEGNNSENKSTSGAANGDDVGSEAVGGNQTPESVIGLDAEAQNGSETSTAGQP